MAISNNHFHKLSTKRNVVLRDVGPYLPCVILPPHQMIHLVNCNDLYVIHYLVCLSLAFRCAKL